jgi:hypothetical protein
VAAAPFAFQIYVPGDPPRQGEQPKESCVFVEVSPEVLTMIPAGQSKDKAELEEAQRIARKAALEAIRSERERDCSVAQIGELPAEIRSRAVTLQKNGVRAWVAGDGQETSRDADQ